MTDDFTKIQGISKKITHQLNEVGILTFEKLAAMSPEEIVTRLGLSSGITLESIVKKNWVAQAAKLAEKGRTQSTSESTIAPIKDIGSGLHAENYMVELFLDDANSVCQTRVRHVQSEEEVDWENWDGHQLIGYFEHRRELNLPAQIAATSFLADEKPTKMPKERTSKPATRLIGKPQLRKLELIPENLSYAARSFDHDQAFNLQLGVDLTDVAPRGEEPLNYNVNVRAKRLGERQWKTVITGEGSAIPTDNISLNLPATTLSPGVYRFAAALHLSPQIDEEEKQPSKITANIESELFELY